MKINTMVYGNIFDIKRSSFEDGPGIRTTIFFKGCNLRCQWCHNPESWEDRAQVMLYINKCTECGRCRDIIKECAGHECNACGRCVSVCPNGARVKVGRRYTPDEIMEVVLRDKAFYDASGGGVTFSGGECMLQIDFLLELLKSCKENQIHTAVDTAGNVPYEYFERCADYTDLIMYDIKCITPELHKAFTGVSNELILLNLKKLPREKIIIRIPIINGFNNTPVEKAKIYDFLNELDLNFVEELPYHRLGEIKHGALAKHIKSRKINRI